MLGQVGAAAGGVVGIRLLTGAISPAVYGQVALAMTGVVLFQQCVLGPLSQACLRFFAPAQETGELHAYFRVVWRLLAYASISVAGLGIAGAIALFGVGQQGAVGLALAGILLSVISGLGFVFDAFQNAARQRTVVAWHQTLMQWARPLLAVAMVSGLGATASVTMLGYALAALLVACSQLVLFYVLIFRTVPAAPADFGGNRARLTDQILSYAWPFATWGGLTWLQLASDRWALGAFQSVQVVGVYAVLYQIGYYPMNLLATAVNQLVAPIFYRVAGDGTDPDRLGRAVSLSRRLVLIWLMASAGLALLTVPLARPVVSLLVAPEYRSNWQLLPLLVLASGLFASGQFAALIFQITVQAKRLIAPKITTAIVGTLLNVGGAYFMGLTGVVLANVVFAAAYVGWTTALTYSTSSRTPR
jgi:O-antigen/teichoic acid export membrane protein